MNGPLNLALELERASRRVSLRIAQAGVVAVMAALLLPLGMLDYTFRFGRGARGILAGTLVVAAAAAWRILQRKFQPFRSETDAAGFVERMRKDLKSLFLTGVEAEAGRATGDPEFSERVVRAASASVGSEAYAVVDRRPLRTALRVLLVAAVVGGALFIANPEASARHALRVLLPAARIDAATATRISVAPGDAVVTRGDSIAIRAITTGVLPPDATLIVTDETGSVTRMPMEVILGDTSRKIFEAVIPRVDASFRYEIAAGDARTYACDVKCAIPPSLLRLVVRVRWPEYTGRAPEELIDPGELHVLLGSRVEIAAEADRTLSAADLVQDTAATSFVPMRLDGSRATVEFAPRESCALDFRLAGRDGASGRTHRDIALVVFEDRPPDVRILSPRREIKAMATEEIPFDVVAKDDFGLTGLNVYVAVAAETEVVWKKLVMKCETAVLSFDFPLEDLSLEIGDAVHIRVEGTDAAGGATSRERMVTIIPFERFYRFQAQFPLGAIEALLPAIKKYIELEKGVISHTTESLGHDQPELDRSADHQENVRAELGKELHKLREAMKREDPLEKSKTVIDQVFVEAERAGEDMARARDNLHGGKGGDGVSAERAALNRLMKVFQSILTIVTNAAGVKTEQMEQDLADQFENLPRDTWTGSSGQPHEAAIEQTKSLLDRAREMMQNGSGSPDDVKKLADDVDRMAKNMENGAESAKDPGAGDGSSAPKDQRSGGEGQPSNSTGDQRNQGGGSGPGSQGGSGDGANPNDRNQNARQASGNSGADRRDQSPTPNPGGGGGNQTDTTGGNSAQNQTDHNAGNSDQNKTPAPKARGDSAASNGGASGALQQNSPDATAAGGAGGATAANMRGDRAAVEQLRELARQLRQAAAQSGGEVNGSGGSGALVALLGRLVDLLEVVRDTADARTTIDELLERIENDPDSVPPEMREIVRRYFELLR